MTIVLGAIMRTALVTGGNAGIGYFIAEHLAAAGLEVVLGSRSAARGRAAAGAIRARVPGARVACVPLDLADLSSLTTSVAAVPADHLDVVVLNAGVLLADPIRRETAAGHELTFATNHLGHFALVALLWPRLAKARIVTQGSFTARSATLDLGDLQSTRSYDPKRAYERSKLAQLLFAFELARRLEAAGSGAAGLAVHPGGALDALTPSRPPVHVRTTAQALRAVPAGLVLQGKHAGARPAVHAALDPSVRNGQLWGPRFFGLRGRPRLERAKGPLADAETAARLWAASAELTGVDPGFVTAPA
ncbi:SDR family NAD(P)-dependent oxidoreductase [Amycolatopsis sp. NPDC051903]|uniref:SDR family NAD(P)-dependent oxidoreductase n=1 Tax=Amycolatopsis sp. NPDC051903 TaxID=3363936 RepID=UPI0037BABC08